MTWSQQATRSKGEQNWKERSIYAFYDKIKVPVLFGRNGQLEKCFQVDAFLDGEDSTVLEVEAGSAVTNYQFLKDLFEACMMHNVAYLMIGVRKIY